MKKIRSILNKLRPHARKLFTALVLISIAAFAWIQRNEVLHVSNEVKTGNTSLILIGIGVTVLYLFLHAWMYQASFQVIGRRIPFLLALKLFLRRNLASVFLPGGGVTSLALFTKEIESHGVNRTRIHAASSIYGAIGIVSLLLIAFPVLIFEGLTHSGLGQQWTAFGSLAALTGLVVYSVHALRTENTLYRRLCTRFPGIKKFMIELSTERMAGNQLVITLLFSLLIEVAGMFHLYIALAALGLNPGMGSCITGYTIATLFLCISPFLRGLGAVEVSLVIVLQQSGLTPTQAMAATLLYRFFEFWLPLLAGIASFLANKSNILLRVFPAVLIFLLGTINMISVLTPAVSERLKLLNQFLPVELINASNYLVLVMGGILIITSVFLFRGFKNAWYLALVISALSLVGHLTKAIDYEESTVAALVMLSLVYTRKQYYVQSNRPLQLLTLNTTVTIIVAVLLYGLAGFYFLDKIHFGIDFSFNRSVMATLDNFFLLNSQDLQPLTTVGTLFLYSINIFGTSLLTLLFYAFLKPYVMTGTALGDTAKARKLLLKYGQSPVDYFKVYPDKQLFFGSQEEGFLAYKVSGHFAVVLEEPVCRNLETSRQALLNEFEQFCKKNSKRPFYYRIGEKQVSLYRFMGKHSVLIGQEAVIDLQSFSLEGKQRKSLRNAVNSVQKKGFVSKIYEGPLSDGLVLRLKMVSDEWLRVMDRSEIVFSQGMFDREEIRHHTVITLENEYGKIVGFLNLIPDYSPGEATYDLIRKTEDAPGGIMDVLIIELIAYCREKGFHRLNLGMAPFSGIGRASNIPEHTLKFAYEKIQSFRQYRGLRDFKEKFDPSWENKYLVYDYHYDLLRLPLALNKLMKP